MPECQLTPKVKGREILFSPLTHYNGFSSFSLLLKDWIYADKILSLLTTELFYTGLTVGCGSIVEFYERQMDDQENQPQKQQT